METCSVTREFLCICNEHINVYHIPQTTIYTQGCTCDSIRHGGRGWNHCHVIGIGGCKHKRKIGPQNTEDARNVTGCLANPLAVCGDWCGTAHWSGSLVGTSSASYRQFLCPKCAPQPGGVIVSPPPERKKVMEALESIDPSIMISSGSACTSDDAMPSHVLTAIRIPPEYIHGSVRISLGHTNTLESVLSVLCRALEKLLDGISDPNSAINTNVLKR